MAELKQGVEYEITAKDNTGPGVQSATETVNKGAENASKASEKVAKDFKAGFSPMSAITAALSGNFQALGQQMMGLVTRLKGVHMSMMQFSLYSALVMGLVKAVSSLVEYFENAKKQAEKIKLDNAAASLETMKKESAEFAAAMERARKDTEAIFEAQNREVSSLEALTKAYNEYAKAQELALAKSDKERQDIETRYKSTNAHNAREISAEQRRIEREKLDKDLERMKEELAQAEEDRDKATRKAAKYGGKADRYIKAASADNLGSFGWGPQILNLFANKKREKALESAANWGGKRDDAAKEAMEANTRIEELDREIADAEHRREMLDVQEETAQLEEAAELQTELNEAWAEVDEAEKKEIEEIKEAAIEAAEDVKVERLKAQKEVKDTRMRDLREATEAEAAAQQRLAAAKAQVDRAWGWYRDKDSLAAQLEEEKADAAAQAQFEKDFEKLRYRRDWREAKDLSLDQEAVRRVALAREEEASAQRAVEETAENTRRAAQALEDIQQELMEG